MRPALRSSTSPDDVLYAKIPKGISEITSFDRKLDKIIENGETLVYQFIEQKILAL